MTAKTWRFLGCHTMLEIMTLFFHFASTAPATPYIQSSSGLASTNFGVPVTLTCNVSHTTSLSYRWMLDGHTVQQAEASNTYLVDANDETADSGSYLCETYDDTGAANSTGFTLTVLPAPATPVIAHSAVNYGDTVTLACSTASVGSFAYEFFADNVSSGAPGTSSTIAINQVSFASENTAHTCKVYHNGNPSEKSTAFHLTVKPNKPVISESGSRTDAGILSLTCVSTSDSTASLTYNWYKDTNLTNPLQNKLSQTLTFDPLTFSDAGTYRCKALHGSVASDVSASLAVTVNPQTPTVNINSNSSTVEEGTTVTLTCETRSDTSATSVTYTWFDQNYYVISGPQASNSLITSTMGFAAAGVYMCSVTMYGIPSDTSVEFQLTVQPQAPHVSLLQPLPLTDLDPVTLECSSPSIGQNTAGLTLVYTWYHPSGAPISGQSRGNYSFVVTLDSEGSYACQVTRNGIMSSVGSALNVTVRPRRPTVTGTGEGLVEGVQVNLTCNTASTPSPGQTFTYQWLKDSAAAPGTMPYLAFSPLRFSDKGSYTCIIVHKGVQSQTSFTYPLTVQPQKPAVSGGPTVQEGTNVTLTCTSPSSGMSSPIAYRWRYSDGSRDTEIAGAQDQTYIITGNFRVAGDYSCSVATNGTFSDFSDYYSLKVIPRTPTIAPTESQPVLDLGSVNLSCITDSPLAGNEVYAWYFNGAVIPTALSASYIISNVSFQQAGEYNCSVNFGVSSSGVSAGYVISVKPQTPSIQQEGGTAVDGRALTLTCTTPSVLPSTDPSKISYTWSRTADDTAVISGASSTRRYTFTPTFSDNGDYFCMVAFDSVPSEYSSAYPLAVHPQTPTVQGPTAVQESQSVTLTCASGSAGSPYPASSYTWYGVDGNPISGQSNSMYSISSVSYASAGTYSCEVTYATSTSNRSVGFELSVKPQTPVVVSSAGNPVLDGESTNLICNTSSVDAGGGQYYKWFDSKGVRIAGQNNSYYQLSPVTVAKRGYYSCSVVYNNVESLKTDYPFYLSVKPKTPVVAVSGMPAIDQGSVTLECTSLSVTTTDNPTYAWLDGSGSQIAGQSKKQYSIRPVTFSSPAASYTCHVVLNNVTSDSSPAFPLQVQPKPASLRTNDSMPLADGSPLVLQCSTDSPLTGTAVYTFTNTDTGVNLATNISNSDFYLGIVTLRTSGSYTCKITHDGVDSAVSSPALVLSVRPHSPDVVSSKTPSTEGDAISLTCSTTSDVSAAGGVVSYRWRTPSGEKNSSSASIDLQPLAFGDAGNYSCSVSYRGTESDTSSDYLLQVTPPTPYVSGVQTAAQGSSVTYSCATGFISTPTSQTFTWYRNGVPLSSTSVNLIMSPASFSDTGAYSCTVNANGVLSASSQPLTLKVKPQTPTVVAEVSLPVQDGGNVPITCQTSSERLINSSATYTFYGTGDVIIADNLTNKTFTLTAVTLASAGSYKCKVIYLGVSSDVSATPLLVTVRPAQPQVQATPVLPAEEDQSLTLTCQTQSSLSGGKAVAYAWKDPRGLVIAGASSAIYTMTVVSFSQAGSYTCQVSYNAVPSDYSAGFPVTVKPATPVLSGMSSGQAGASLSLTCSSLSAVDFFIFVSSAGETVVKNLTSNPLTFLPLRLNDTGKYKCRVAKNGLDSAYSNEVQLTVVPRTPVLSITPSAAVADGSNATFSCTSISYNDMAAEGYTTTLYHNNGGTLTPVSPAGAKWPYVITVSTAQAGSYVCSVTFRQLESAKSSAVNLLVKPATPVVTLLQSEAVDASAVSLQCGTGPKQVSPPRGTRMRRRTPATAPCCPSHT